MSKEVFNLILKDYPTEMQISAKRREIWIHQSEGDKIPKHILNDINSANKGRYYYDEQGWVMDSENGYRVIRNSKTAGKPRVQQINGQTIWDGTLAMFSRNDLKKFLSAYFIPNIARQLPPFIKPGIGKYIHFEYLFFLTKESMKQDIDNHAYPYIKAFMDAMQTSGVISQDDASIVRGNYARYIEIEPTDQRRLEIKIHFCYNNESI